MEPYYYQKMNKPQQAAYHAMQQGVLALADEIQLPRIPAEELYDVFFRLRLDHPEIFWVVSYRYRYYQDSPNIIFVPEYLFEKNKIREHQKAMQSRVEKLARSAAKFTEWEKEKYIHDFICGNNPEKGIKYRHTWNIVRIGGQYYHLDATFDNTLGKHQGNAEAPGEIRYDYFNLGDKAVFRDHEPLIAPAPGCPDNDHFYYKEKKLSFTKTEEVYKRAQQMAKKGRAMTFQWRGGYLTREVLQELLELIRKAGEERQKTARISLNWPQAVIHFSYVENAGIPEPEVVMEDANEGEQFDTGE